MMIRIITLFCDQIIIVIITIIKIKIIQPMYDRIIIFTMIILPMFGNIIIIIIVIWYYHICMYNLNMTKPSLSSLPNDNIIFDHWPSHPCLAKLSLTSLKLWLYDICVAKSSLSSYDHLTCVWPNRHFYYDHIIQIWQNRHYHHMMISPMYSKIVIIIIAIWSSDLCMAGAANIASLRAETSWAACRFGFAVTYFHHK